jgi:hypothetical protein
VKKKIQQIKRQKKEEETNTIAKKETSLPCFSSPIELTRRSAVITEPTKTDKYSAGMSEGTLNKSFELKIPKFRHVPTCKESKK